mmetsp:Transcript_147/g.355  ORF Transcript_147/g.355 Transcript_147/m.355 type:complete len:126 (+) Transcript_147:20-397(+)
MCPSKYHAYCSIAILLSGCNAPMYAFVSPSHVCRIEYACMYAWKYPDCGLRVPPVGDELPVQCGVRDANTGVHEDAVCMTWSAGGIVAQTQHAQGKKGSIHPIALRQADSRIRIRTSASIIIRAI